MRLHARTLPVQAAEADLRLALTDFQENYNLTDIEMLRALQAHEQRLSRRLLRAERHPDDPDRKADEA